MVLRRCLSGRGLRAAAAEPTGAGVLRGAAGAGRGGPARQPDHARHAHHGRGRQRNGHQVSPARSPPAAAAAVRGEDGGGREGARGRGKRDATRVGRR